MRIKGLFIAVSTLTFMTPIQAANTNPATADYVQSQMTNVLNYVKSQLANIPVSATYTVGQHALGGIVFYVDSTGTHGLVAATQSGTAGNQTWDGGISQNTGYSIIVNAKGNGRGAGAMNTSLMVGVQSGYVAYLSSPLDGSQTYSLSSMPAQFCVNYSVQADGSDCTPNTAGASCIGNWYLPSLYELNQMYLQKNLLGYPFNGSLGAFLWSSTEYDQDNAWRINFTANSNQQTSTSKSDASDAWCIHSF